MTGLDVALVCTLPTVGVFVGLWAGTGLYDVWCRRRRRRSLGVSSPSVRSHWDEW